MTPQPNPCGLVVDFVRSCYESNWRFYASQPDVVTRGYYYFVPAGTPCVPFYHPWFSGDWTSDEPYPDSLPGPVRKAPRKWRRGDITVFPPRAGTVGTQAQIAGQQSFPGDVYNGPLYAGIPATCWTQYGIPFLPVDVVFNLTECCIQQAYARIIQLLYNDDTADITDFFASWLGPGATVTHMALAGTFPQTCLVTSADYALVFVSGTSNFQQIALQGAAGLAAPQDFGAYSTQPLWQATASTILSRISDLGVAPTTPVLFCGHSYGAAVAAVLGARAIAGNRTRRTAVLTFAMPKPGDTRLIDLLAVCYGFHIWNTGDVVPLLPPGPVELEGVFAGLTDPIRRGWLSWRGVPAYYQMDADGTKTWGNLNSVDLFELRAYIDRLLAALPINPITPHFLTEYSRRLAIGCACPNPVVPAEPWRILFPAVAVGPGGVKMGTVEPSKDDFAEGAAVKFGHEDSAWFGDRRVGAEFGTNPQVYAGFKVRVGVQFGKGI